MGATMPVWGAVVLSIVVALVPQIAAFFMQRSRLEAEAERLRSQRDEDRAAEWHRNVRWAAEQIIAGSDRGRLTGVEMLDALDDAEFVTDLDRAMIDAILLTVLDPALPNSPAEGYDEVHDDEGGDEG
ncbi:hypothetical protein [uncultured Corynebacterium sp.]|uniref:hypothetical protein n=1 Tax=uncultured Corynebacterium sp. TaxID=159447 RepID=UPI0025F987AA|nr:hypothetical protein [uncultured Corynebacterium sp.]